MQHFYNKKVIFFRCFVFLCFFYHKLVVFACGIRVLGVGEMHVCHPWVLFSRPVLVISTAKHRHPHGFKRGSLLTSMVIVQQGRFSIKALENDGASVAEIKKP